MSDQLNLFDTRSPRAESGARRNDVKDPGARHGEAIVTDRKPREKAPGSAVEETIEQRWDAFSARNPHVLTAALEIARAWLERGDKYISAKAIMENLRVKNIKGGEVRGDGGYKLNNDFTAPLGRWLVQHEPKLDGIIRFRERKAR